MQSSDPQMWSLLKHFFKDKGLVKQHIDSYNDFVEKGLQAIVDEVGEIPIEIEEYSLKIKLGKIEIGTPRVTEVDGSERQIYPTEARVRNLTYAAPLHLEMIPIIGEREGQTEIVYIGDFPVMLKSKICPLSSLTSEELVRIGEDPLDPGGYFIVNGSERVVVALEDLAPNKILVDVEKTGVTPTYKAKIFSTTVGFRARIEVTMKSDGAIFISMPGVPADIPIIVMMKALGIEEDAKIAELVSPEMDVQSELESSFDKAQGVISVKDAFLFVGNRLAPGQVEEYRMKKAETVVDRNFLPHLGRAPANRFDKAVFLAEIANRIIELKLGKRGQDDKDHYANKRLKLAGSLLAELFRIAFRNLTRDLKYQLERITVKRHVELSIVNAVRPGIITERVQHAIATGNWVRGRVGVTQLLDRTNFSSTLSHLRRLQSPLSRSQPNLEARDLHPTHWGRLCPNETPEGSNCVVPSTNVLLADGTQVAISELADKWQDTELATVDIVQDDMAQTTIARYIKTDPSANGTTVFRITTESGRELIATEDHPLLAEELRWKPAGEVKLGDRVVVYPLVSPVEKTLHSARVILTAKHFGHSRRKWEKTWVPDELQRLSLLPLDSLNPKLPVLARIIGAIFSDGHLHMKKSPFVQFSLGTEEDAREVDRDLARLGFKSKIIVKTKHVKRPERQYQMTIYTVTCYSKTLCVLLEKLGAPAGKKTDTQFLVPAWIMEGSEPLKIEFLSAYLGGDGSKPSVAHIRGKKYSIRMPPIHFHKVVSQEKNGLAFAKQIAKLLEDLGCECTQVVSRRDYRRSDGKVMSKISIVPRSSKTTLEAITQKIGYRYAKTKQRQALLVGEYLRICRRLTTARAERKKLAQKLYGEGQFPSQIAPALGEKRKTIENWLYWKNYEQTYKPKSMIPTFAEWVRSNVISIGNDDFVLERIVSKEPVSGITDVRDVTTASESHNFIANGFVTHNCGLVKNLALSATISVGVDPKDVVNKLHKMGVVRLEEADKKLRQEGAQVIVDGIIAGYCKDPEALAEEIKALRRTAKLSSEVNVVYYPSTLEGAKPELYVNCDAGRVRRPLIIVENGKPKLTEDHVERIQREELRWEDLIKEGVIEYLDADEEENALVALDSAKITERTTHLELASYATLGICASLIPYAEHNQSPRNAYESAMAKQALGVFSTNFFNRVDSRAHLLHYPQSPTVKTKPMEIINFGDRPCGQNCVVAVLSFQGYNMEDAIILNKSSVDRGLARSTFFRIYEAECRQYLGGLRDKLEVPEAGIRGYRGDRYYRLLEEDGIISVESPVSGNAVLIGRTSPPRFLEEYREFEVRGPTKRDSSVCMRPSESGVVDLVFMSESIEGSKLVKVKVRDLRVPELGDKFASRHGQKGVIGLMVPEEDMPFTEEGLVPDIIINPHAIPSRMTIGQFVETVAGKVAAIRGEEVDGTPFSNENPDSLREALLNLGFQYSGREVLYSGISGEKLAADVFIGVVYYQKLHHMVSDKMHARARGQVQMLTRQPTEGRARGGGLRFGEMERDCLIGHGASALLRDRLLEESDKYVAIVCENCGLLAYHDIKQNKYICRICGEKAVISPVAMSYAFKLLVQELMALGIAPRVKVEERA